MNEANYSPIEIETFKELLTERGSPDIYFVVRKVSKSGMSRVISFYYFSADGGCHCLDQIICQLGDFSYSEKTEGVRIHGAGMDMAWYCLYRFMGKLLGSQNEQNFNHSRL